MSSRTKGTTISPKRRPSKRLRKEAPLHAAIVTRLRYALRLRARHEGERMGTGSRASIASVAADGVKPTSVGAPLTCRMSASKKI